MMTAFLVTCVCWLKPSVLHLEVLLVFAHCGIDLVTSQLGVLETEADSEIKHTGLNGHFMLLLWVIMSMYCNSCYSRRVAIFVRMIIAII